MPETHLKRELGLRDLTLFAVICITSTRWVPIAAHAGPSSIVLWLLAAVLFAAPLTVAVAALAAKYPGVGGLYLWTRQDFGAWHALLGFWSYWLGIAFLFQLRPFSMRGWVSRPWAPCTLPWARAVSISLPPPWR